MAGGDEQGCMGVGEIWNRGGSGVGQSCFLALTAETPSSPHPRKMMTFDVFFRSRQGSRALGLSTRVVAPPLTDVHLALTPPPCTDVYALLRGPAQVRRPPQVSAAVAAVFLSHDFLPRVFLLKKKNGLKSSHPLRPCGLRPAVRLYTFSRADDDNRLTNLRRR
jgi:hypothetical protein